MFECIKSEWAYCHTSPCGIVLVESCVDCRVKDLQRAIGETTSVSIVNEPKGPICASKNTVLGLFIGKISRRAGAHCHASPYAHVSVFVRERCACAIGNAHVICGIVVKIGIGRAIEDTSSS